MPAKKRPQRNGRPSRSAQPRRTTQAQLPPTGPTELQQNAEAEDLTRRASETSLPEPTAVPTPADGALPQGIEVEDPPSPQTEVPRPAENPTALAVAVPPPGATAVPPPFDREAPPVDTPPQAQPTRRRQPTTGHGQPQAPKLSALDAAARVLGETGQPMTCPELIRAMAERRYWVSPKGRTPQATLYAALLREINAKGSNARFQKAERGKFGRRTQA